MSVCEHVRFCVAICFTNVTVHPPLLVLPREGMCAVSSQVWCVSSVSSVWFCVCWPHTLPCESCFVTASMRLSPSHVIVAFYMLLYDCSLLHAIVWTLTLIRAFFDLTIPHPLPL